MLSYRTLGQVLALVVMAGMVHGCKDSGGSGGGGSTQVGSALQWIDPSQAPGVPSSSTPLLWLPPGSGGGNVLDVYDSIISVNRTYTNPIIYQLGNVHPLNIDAPALYKTPSDALRQMLIDWRYQQYVLLTGDPPAPGALLAQHTILDQIALAHCYHYAKFYPMDGTFQANGVNPEGDALGGRLAKNQITTSGEGEWRLADIQYAKADDVFDYVINQFNGAIQGVDILNPNWTHIGVGFWRNPNTAGTYYWNIIFATDPQSAGGGGFGNLIVGVGGVIP